MDESSISGLKQNAQGSIDVCSIRMSARVSKLREDKKEMTQNDSDGANESSETYPSYDDQIDAAESSTCKPGVNQNEGYITTTSSNVVVKPRRSWEQWSFDDTAVFFEAINEFGKKFNLIETYFKSKNAKKKSANTLCTTKNREQIRTFYYRTWHKISRYLTFPDNLKKSCQELYGLINYGEMRKRLCGVMNQFDDKLGAKLEELVVSGYTCLRIKGKNFRIKTPVCRALKRINDRYDAFNQLGCERKRNSLSQSDSLNLDVVECQYAPLPQNLIIDLKPFNSSDFSFVHGQCFQNPFLKVKIPLQYRMSQMIDLLVNKWRTSDEKLLDVTRRTLSNADDSMMINKNNDSDDLVNTIAVKYERKLFLMIHPKSEVCVPSIKSVKPMTSSSLCLSALQAKIEKKEECEYNNNMSNRCKSDDGISSSSPIHILEADKIVKEELEDTTEQICTEWNDENGSNLTFGELCLMMVKSKKSFNSIEMFYTWRYRLKQEFRVKSFDSDENNWINLNLYSSSSQFNALSRIAAIEMGRVNHFLKNCSDEERSVSLNTFSPVQNASEEMSIERHAMTSHLNFENNTNNFENVQQNTNIKTSPVAVAPSRGVVRTLPTIEDGKSVAFQKQLSMLIPKYGAVSRKSRVTSRMKNNTVLPIPSSSSNTPIPLLRKVVRYERNTIQPTFSTDCLINQSNIKKSVINSIGFQNCIGWSNDSFNSILTPEESDDSTLNVSSFYSTNSSDETSQMSASSEVDRQLISMMNESSIDFTRNFESLASHVISNNGDPVVNDDNENTMGGGIAKVSPSTS